MSEYGPQVKLARLYEKTSKTGNQYFVGRPRRRGAHIRGNARG